MKNKIKNPLYVVKGNDVQEANGVFDLVIKKLSLEPVILFIQSMLKLLLEQIKSYPTFIAIKAFLDEFFEKYLFVLKKIIPQLA
jgi:hypothetical protein